MPGRDKTGPQGAGPLTGRGLGRCGGTPGIESTDRAPGYGRGRGGGGRGLGFGGGRGRGAPQPTDAAALLARRADALAAELADVQRQLERLAAGRSREEDER